MRYYRYKRKASQKAKAIFLKVLFILIAAAIITVMAVVTGNLLLHKVEAAEDYMETSVPPSGNAVIRVDPVEGSLTDDSQSTLQVFASALDLTLYDTEDSLFARIHDIAQTYNTISVPVTDANGLLYVSDALSDLIRLPDTGANTEEYTRLTNLITAARAQGLRISAVLTSSLSHLDNNVAVLVDSTIAAELYTMGCNEILITGLLEPDADTDAITNVRRYLQSIHDTLSGMGSFQLGALLPYSIYLDAANAKQVQMLSSAVDFLAMDASNVPVADNGAMTLSELCAALAGSFEVYNLRVVLNTADPILLTAQYNTLVRMEISNIHFLRETNAEVLTEEEEPEIEVLPPEEETEETIPTTNPYATTNPSPGTTTRTHRYTAGSRNLLPNRWGFLVLIPHDILYMHTNHTITCYIFRTSGDLIHFFPCDQRTSDISISVPTMLPAPAHCMSRQQDFYLALSAEDADKFAAFCRSSSSRTQIPALLLFPDPPYAAVFAERYTAQTLSRSDPLPGNTAAFLGQSAMQTLRTVLPNHHLIPALLFSSMKELYSVTSPIYTLMPETVRALIRELEHLQEPDAIFTQTLPFLRSYQKELSATDIPVFLNIPAAISQLIPMLSDRPLFQDLQIRFRPSDISPGIYHTRLSLSVFTYLFVLLTYITALLDDDHITNLSLYRDGTDACLVFRAETDILPRSLSCRSEFFSLLPHLPRYESLLSLTQYLLHRNGIRFTCTVSRTEYPSINFTLRMDTRIREEIEFRVGDIDDKLNTALPEALDLLAHLIAPPPADPAAE